MAQSSLSVDIHFDESPDRSAEDLVELVHLLIIDKNTY